jgi:competence ComEA-like helix-hairpin-helix protein
MDNNARALGLTRQNSVVLLTIALLFIVYTSGGWILGMHHETSLPEKEDIVVIVNINSADVGELTLLPGVGQTTAELIVKERNQSGPFKCMDDLVRVRGIGPSAVKRIAPHAECR